jgi:hypothetical protein
MVYSILNNDTIENKEGDKMQKKVGMPTSKSNYYFGILALSRGGKT